MKTIQWVIDSIKIEDRKVARFGKDHLTARGAAEHATYRVLGSRRDKRWLAARKLIEDALVAKEMKPMLTDGLASAKCLRSRVTLRPSMRWYAPPAQRPFGPCSGPAMMHHARSSSIGRSGPLFTDFFAGLIAPQRTAKALRHLRLPQTSWPLGLPSSHSGATRQDQ
jgi:hypothetical protein